MKTNGAVAVVFDADDTLWDTPPLYETSKKEFFRFMEQLGFTSGDVSTRFEAIDHANVAKFGFSKKRFPQSMRDTYSVLCASYARPFDKGIAEKTLKIGSTVFDASPMIFPGVTDVLSDLKGGGIKLLLATKGDRDVQTARIDASGLRPYFQRVYVLKDKGVKEFEKIIVDERIEPSRAYSVGNSVRSDIIPALSAGLNAILIPRETWAYERIDVIQNERLHIVESIRDVPDIVLQTA